MKKSVIILSLILSSIGLFAQEKDSSINVIIEEEVIIKNIESGIIQKRDVPEFTGLIIKGTVINVILSQSTESSVKVQADEKEQSKVNTVVENGILTVDSKALKNPTVFIDVKTFNSLIITDVANVNTSNQIKTDYLLINSNGVGKIKIDILSDSIVTEISGASTITFSGKGKSLYLNIDGAGDVNAEKFECEKAIVNISGAGKAKLNAEKEISGEISGASVLFFKGDPDLSNINVSGAATFKGIGNEVVKGIDTVKVKVGKYKFDIVEDNDEEFDDSGNHNHEYKISSKEFKSWAGLDFGINGFLNAQNQPEIPSNYNFLELNYRKSIGVGLNLFEKDFPIIRNYVDLATGLGFEYNNYRFSGNTRLLNNSDSISGINDTMFAFSKSKLRVTYLTIPLLLELNTNRNPQNAFHLAAGLLLGYNLGSKTKMVYYSDGDIIKEKSEGNYHINPFRYGLTARLGYGTHFLAYAIYNLSEMFVSGEGPELYPFTVGVSFIGG